MQKLSTSGFRGRPSLGYTFDETPVTIAVR